MHTVAARALRRCVFTVCFPVQSFTRLYKHAVQIDVRANARTLLLDLFHTHTLHSHTLLHVNIVDKPSLNLSIHILLRPFIWQTDDEE